VPGFLFARNGSIPRSFGWDIADVMATYHQLNYQRKPEHLQWWLPKEAPKMSPLTKQESQLVRLAFNDGSADWAQGVLSNTRVAAAVLSVPTAGAHTLRVYGIEAGVVIDKLVLFKGEPPRGYLGPTETRVSGK
jgi:hypothetical protein